MVDFRQQARARHARRQAEQSAEVAMAFAPVADAKVELTGEVSFSRLVNQSSGWGFARILVNRLEISIIGIIEELYEAAEVTVHGRWVEHERHGWQIDCDLIEVVLPTDGWGVEAWLEVGFVDIGPKRARALVEAFPPPLLWEVLEGDPDRLQEVEGIGPGLQASILGAYEMNKHGREAFVALAAMGLRSRQIRSACVRWGARDVVKKIKANPYVLRQLPGVGWKQADILAKRQGVKQRDPRRLLEGIAYATEVLERAGHCCASYKKLCATAASADVLSVRLPVVFKIWPDAVDQGYVVEGPGKLFYRPVTDQAEAFIADRVGALMAFGAVEPKET